MWLVPSTVGITSLTADAGLTLTLNTSRWKFLNPEAEGKSYSPPELELITLLTLCLSSELELSLRLLTVAARTESSLARRLDRRGASTFFWRHAVKNVK